MFVTGVHLKKFVLQLVLVLISQMELVKWLLDVIGVKMQKCAQLILNVCVELLILLLCVRMQVQNVNIVQINKNVQTSQKILLVLVLIGRVINRVIALQLVVITAHLKILVLNLPTQTVIVNGTLKKFAMLQNLEVVIFVVLKTIKMFVPVLSRIQTVNVNFIQEMFV